MPVKCSSERLTCVKSIFWWVDARWWMSDIWAARNEQPICSTPTHPCITERVGPERVNIPCYHFLIKVLPFNKRCTKTVTYHPCKCDNSDFGVNNFSFWVILFSFTIQKLHINYLKAGCDTKPIIVVIFHTVVTLWTTKTQLIAALLSVCHFPLKYNYHILSKMVHAQNVCKSMCEYIQNINWANRG
jgi:hypothetical protein